MYSNYFKIAFRNLKSRKGHAALNVIGLSVGMTVAMLIGLWVYDELTFDTYHENYNQIAQVLQHKARNGGRVTRQTMPFPLGDELRNEYGRVFKHVVMSAWTEPHVLGYDQKKILKSGTFMEASAPEMLSLKMIHGTRNVLTAQNAILLSSSTAKSLFGQLDVIGKQFKIDNELNVMVGGVYEDLPRNTSFHDLQWIGAWKLYVSAYPWVKSSRNSWDNNSHRVFVQVADHTSFEEVNKKIQLTIYDHLEEHQRAGNEVFLHRMSDWHLRNNWVNGEQAGGNIQYVFLFCAIGIFVLILACINFMNLSTAQSIRRSREVGIRKAMGSFRYQLIAQFLCESLVMAAVAFVASIGLLLLAAPYFSVVSGKDLSLPFTAPLFWIVGLLFVIVTSIFAGSYPAFYLSAFRATNALKGTTGTRSGTTLRKGLVVVQFVVSVSLIIGTFFIHEQIAYTQSRPSGYNSQDLIMIKMVSQEYEDKYDLFKHELESRGLIQAMAESSSSLIEVNSSSGGFHWQAMDPDFYPHLVTVWVTHDFGKTVGWELIHGRDFDRNLVSDSSAFIINETAAEYLGIEQPIGAKIHFNNKQYEIIGIVKDIVRESPFEAVKPAVYLINSTNQTNWFTLKLNHAQSTQSLLAEIEEVFMEIAPNVPFDFQFVNHEYSQKFNTEKRIGKLAGVFAGLAILISCLGLIGLTSFIAEQRTKEIGIRKVLGATVLSLWHLLSKEFILLVMAAGIIAIPIAYYFLDEWLNHYQYRIDLDLVYFVLAIAAALCITIVTVSIQAIKAALANPINSLKSE